MPLFRRRESSPPQPRERAAKPMGYIDSELKACFPLDPPSAKAQIVEGLTFGDIWQDFLRDAKRSRITELNPYQEFILERLFCQFLTHHQVKAVFPRRTDSFVLKTDLVAAMKSGVTSFPSSFDNQVYEGARPEEKDFADVKDFFTAVSQMFSSDPLSGVERFMTARKRIEGGLRPAVDSVLNQTIKIFELFGKKPEIAQEVFKKAQINTEEAFDPLSKKSIWWQALYKEGILPDSVRALVARLEEVGVIGERKEEQAASDQVEEEPEEPIELEKQSWQAHCRRIASSGYNPPTAEKTYDYVQMIAGNDPNFQKHLGEKEETLDCWWLVGIDPEVGDTASYQQQNLASRLAYVAADNNTPLLVISKEGDVRMFQPGEEDPQEIVSSQMSHAACFAVFRRSRDGEDVPFRLSDKENPFRGYFLPLVLEKAGRELNDRLKRKTMVRIQLLMPPDFAERHSTEGTDQKLMNMTVYPTAVAYLLAAAQKDPSILEFDPRKSESFTSLQKYVLASGIIAGLKHVFTASHHWYAYDGVNAFGRKSGMTPEAVKRIQGDIMDHLAEIILPEEVRRNLDDYSLLKQPRFSREIIKAFRLFEHFLDSDSGVWKRMIEEIIVQTPNIADVLARKGGFGEYNEACAQYLEKPEAQFAKRYYKELHQLLKLQQREAQFPDIWDASKKADVSPAQIFSFFTDNNYRELVIT